MIAVQKALNRVSRAPDFEPKAPHKFPTGGLQGYDEGEAPASLFVVVARGRL